MVIDPEIGFTADVIRDPSRFVGRTDLIKDCISALNAATGLISVFGKRGVGKSSLLRQIQQMALGEYALAKKAGLSRLIPEKPRTYLTVFYTCDSLIKDGKDLLSRLCNDQSDEDSLLRLVPNDGKEIVEFTRSKEISAGADLKVINWGTKGVESSKYAKVVPNDIVQTFRNFVEAVVGRSRYAAGATEPGSIQNMTSPLSRDCSITNFEAILIWKHLPTQFSREITSGTCSI